MDKQTIIIKENTTSAEAAEFTESEQMWRFAGDYYSLFLRKKWWIILFCLLGTAAALTYTFLQKSKFTAEVKFTSNIDNNNDNSYMNIAQQFGLIGGSTSSAFSGDNLMELMKTPSLINKTLFTTVTINQRPVTLLDYYIESKQLRQQWKKLNSPMATFVFDPDLSKPNYQRDSMLKGFDNDINEEITIDKENKDLDFISVRMTDEDPVIAKTFTETLVKTVTDYYVTITTAKYIENVRVFQAKADSLSRNFGERLSTIASTQDINVNPAKQAASVPIQKQQINVQADNAVYQEVIKNLELSKIQLQKETPFIQIVETPRYPLDEVKPSKLKYSILGFVLGGIIIIAFLVARKELLRLIEKLNTYGKA